jgi:hypothetical protein
VTAAANQPAVTERLHLQVIKQQIRDGPHPHLSSPKASSEVEHPMLAVHTVRTPACRVQQRSNMGAT